MSLGGVWQIIKGAFETSPHLGAVVVLLLWLSLCWKFRLVAVGAKQSLPDLVLSAFSIHAAYVNGVTLAALVGANATSNKADLTGGSRGTAASPWKVGEIYRIYWTLAARGQIVRYTTFAVAFAAFSLLVMHLAQPRAGVSLLNVADLVGSWTVIPLSMLVVLSISMMLNSAHQLPCAAITEHKAQSIILFAW